MGKFELGNQGRLPGAINKRSKEWMVLGDMIRGQHAHQFNSVLSDLFHSDDMEDRIKGAALYLNALEYFQPKYSRVEHVDKDDKTDSVTIVIERSALPS